MQTPSTRELAQQFAPKIVRLPKHEKPGEVDVTDLAHLYRDHGSCLGARTERSTGVERADPQTDHKAPTKIAA